MTMLEVTITMLVLLLAVLPLLASIVAQKTLAVALREVNTANGAIQDKLNEIRVAGNVTFTAVPAYNGQVTQVPSTSGAASNMTLLVNVTPQMVGTPPTITALYVVTVTATWQGVLFNAEGTSDTLAVTELITNRSPP